MNTFFTPSFSFAIYQWGVETLQKVFKKNNIFWFAIYQWGVETTSYALSQFFFKSRSQFTNEELKRTIKTYGISPIWVRNLPMRSWNWFDFFFLHSFHPRSQFTNEELKLKILLFLERLRASNINSEAPPTKLSFTIA